ncbi:hypothetical protein BS47DRAFT_1336735 [Hydnum rufescens UP504]|uniref:Uncharacterized protein n=1 Tax=Hydnum rufescens UP504 TaxID=1448309 RepID=A0A9P6BB87_9AGAM|nr:hypothetical protein BS47DRAFT_1336735 [Hydnum rufescens UP504]
MDDSYWYSRRELAFSLAFPFFKDFKKLSLVSKEFSSLARPYVFRALKPVSTTGLGSQPSLQLFLSEGGWEQACCVRSVTIHLDGLRPGSAYAHPEDAAAKVISLLPFLLHIAIVPAFKIVAGRHVYPARNFDPIARVMARLTRLRSLNMSGPWPGGLSASIDLLQLTAAPLENLEFTISAHRDVQFWAVVASHAPCLQSLKMHEPLDLDKITKIICALPRPDRLRELQISISGSDGLWHQADFWDLLPGLEILYVTNPCRWQDFDHTEDAHPQDGGFPDSPIDSVLGQLDEPQSLSPFLLALPSLRELYVKGGRTFFPWPQPLPSFQSLREGYKNGILSDATDLLEATRVVMSMANREAEVFHHAIVWAQARRRTNFINQQILRVLTWGSDNRGRLVHDATVMAQIAPALGRVRWMPYKEDTSPWVDGDCGDGDFIFDIIFRRAADSNPSVDIRGGIKRVARQGREADVIAPRYAPELPFGGYYDVPWAAMGEELSSLES